MTTAAAGVRMDWAVFGKDGKVLMILSGMDAEMAAHEWEQRGHAVRLMRQPA